MVGGFESSWSEDEGVERVCVCERKREKRASGKERGGEREGKNELSCGRKKCFKICFVFCFGNKKFFFNSKIQFFLHVGGRSGLKKIKRKPPLSSFFVNLCENNSVTI